MHRSIRPHWLTLLVTLPAACGDGGESGSRSDLVDSDAPEYYRDAKAIVDARCATCHRLGDIGPFPLTTYEEVRAFAGPVRASIENGTMPPWQPSDDCNSYADNIDLTAEEEATLLAWLDAGTPEGDPADAPPDADPAPAFQADLTLSLPEPYTPTREPDDYRCQLIPWPAEETRFVTGLRVNPDQRSIVHHAIIFLAGPDEVQAYREYDEAEEGPGYTCYGGPRAGDQGGLSELEPAEVLAALQALGLTVADLQSGNLTEAQLESLLSELGGDTVGGFRSLGSWTPGIPASPFPAGTGIRVEPGSMLVAQFHYNTLSSAPVPDQSVIELSTVRSVEREATSLGAVDFGWLTDGRFGGPAMTIPAGESNVAHSTTLAFDSVLLSRARQELGLPADAPLVVHSANHHMHELGTSQRSELRHADGTSSCVLDIPDWDFQWQGSYTLQSPMTIRPGDSIWMGCTWDNSAANQPIIDGRPRDPVDVSWGEGTSDEMCLGSFYVTAE